MGAADAWFAARGDAEALLELRRIALDCGLVEAIKWRQPCYTDRDRNVVILGRAKGRDLLSFFKGALLADPAGLLEAAGPNTRSGMVIRFADAAAVRAAEPAIRALIAEAVRVERAGLRVAPWADEGEVVPELAERLDHDEAFRDAWVALTPGKRRGFNLHFARAMRAPTRAARIAECTAKIMAGKGLHDCVCGRSKRPPRCDGSHRKPA